MSLHGEGEDVEHQEETHLRVPESRLLFQTGPETILASHNVGIFCNKEIIGQSFGETLDIAEEMAARDALR